MLFSDAKESNLCLFNDVLHLEQIHDVLHREQIQTELLCSSSMSLNSPSCIGRRRGLLTFINEPPLL